MTKRRFPIGLGALVLGLALFGLAPNEAKAIEVMCSNEYGQCEVQNDPSWISCSCNDESSTGGTGGDEYQGLTEAELMAVCEAELSYCMPGEESESEGMTTFGTSDTGEGEGTSTSDTGEGEGEGTSTSDTGEGEGEGTSTSDSGEGDGTTGDGDATGGEGDSSTGGEEGTTGGEGGSGETGGDSGGESGSDGDGDGGTGGDGGDEANEGGGADDQAGDGDGCSVANDSGLGALALFGMFGLLGLRSRKRAC